MSEREYFVISVKHTQRSDSYITLWAPNDCGYRGRVETAGRYTESHILARLGYYNNGYDTVAVPCDITEPMAFSVPDKYFDTDGGHWLRNNAATWKLLLKNIIAQPKYKPAPEYPGAPRKQEAEQ